VQEGSPFPSLRLFDTLSGGQSNAGRGGTVRRFFIDRESPLPAHVQLKGDQGCGHVRERSREALWRGVGPAYDNPGELLLVRRRVKRMPTVTQTSRELDVQSLEEIRVAAGVLV
jgi:hypothetical protein